MVEENGSVFLDGPCASRNHPPPTLHRFFRNMVMKLDPACAFSTPLFETTTQKPAQDTSWTSPSTSW